LASIRLHGDFFVLATMGYQVIAYSVLYNWMDLTGGSYGISAPKPALLGQTISSIEGFALLTACTAALAWWFIARLTAAAYGRTLQAIRDDEMAAQALGKDVAQFRRSAFVISGMLAALAGVLYAGHAGSFDPTSFSIDESIFILCAVIIGGAGNVRGPLIGGLVVVLLPQLLLFVPIPDAVAASVRQILYGLLLVLIMRFRPQGIAGRYAFD
jgi:branched-chain amino acid transport system permease protein